MEMQKQSTQRFLRHAGATEGGPADLSSRGGILSLIKAPRNVSLTV